MIKKEIADKLFKAELSEQQKVELSVADALNTIKGDAKQRINAAANDITRALKELDKTLGKFKEAQNELGIDLSEEIREVSKTYAKAKEILDKADRLIGDISSL